MFKVWLVERRILSDVDSSLVRRFEALEMVSVLPTVCGVTEFKYGHEIIICILVCEIFVTIFGFLIEIWI